LLLAPLPVDPELIVVIDRLLKPQSVVWKKKCNAGNDDTNKHGLQNRFEKVVILPEAERKVDDQANYQNDDMGAARQQEYRQDKKD
jgi:hypothetical protein